MKSKSKSKTILIILDGVSEEEIHELNHMTPLQYAFTPTLNEIIKSGSHNKTIFYPENRDPDSLNCILSILGVNEDMIPKNRAYLEALSAGIKIESDEAVLRCNLISVENNKLKSFNGMGLSKQEMKTASLNVVTKNNLKFYNISDYRNLIIVKKNKHILNLDNMPPHENVGQSMDRMLEFIKCQDVLNNFVNENKIKINETDYMFYPWGVAEPVKLPSFKSLHNKSCCCVCNAEIVRGIAIAMNIELVNLKNSTGDVDTDLIEKASAVLNEIKTHDVVIAHINGTDEISHRKDIRGKIEFIEKIDREFLRVIYDNIGSDTKIVIVSDHRTSTITGKHEKGNVDIIIG